MMNYNAVSVLKNGEFLMANRKTGTVRTFRGETRDEAIAKARRFVANLIWVSKNLTPSDFTYIPEAG